MRRRTIGRLAVEAGVNVETIRYYERRGLLRRPEPGDGKWRIYSREALLTVRFIRLMREFGFTLREIKSVLSHSPDTEAFCGSVGAMARTRIAQLEKDVCRLKEVGAALKQLLETCRRGGGAADCPAWRKLLGLGDIGASLSVKNEPFAAGPRLTIHQEATVCNLSRQEMEERLAAVRELQEQASSVRELQDGFEWKFPGSPAWAAKLCEFVSVERQCCPSFLFELSFEPQSGPIRLSIRGGPEVKAFLESLR